MNIIKNDFVFHNGETEVADGNVLKDPTANQVALYITGSTDSHTIKFEGSDSADDDANWYAVYARKAVDNSYAVQTTGEDECWIVDLTPWVSFKARIDAIAGDEASLTVIGRVVNTAV